MENKIKLKLIRNSVPIEGNDKALITKYFSTHEDNFDLLLFTAFVNFDDDTDVLEKYPLIVKYFNVLERHNYAGYKRGTDTIPYEGELYEGDMVIVKGTRRIGNYTTFVVKDAFGYGYQLKDNRTYFIDSRSLMCIIKNLSDEEEA